jgi:hypothetical protein
MSEKRMLADGKPARGRTKNLIDSSLRKQERSCGRL